MAFQQNCTGTIQVIIMIICDNHPVEYGHQCGTTLNNNTSITSAHGVEYKGSTVDQSKYYSLH